MYKSYALPSGDCHSERPRLQGRISLLSSSFKGGTETRMFVGLSLFENIRASGNATRVALCCVISLLGICGNYGFYFLSFSSDC